MTICDKDGGGVNKTWNSCDIIYGCPLMCVCVHVHVCVCPCVKSRIVNLVNYCALLDMKNGRKSSRIKGDNGTWKGNSYCIANNNGVVKLIWNSDRGISNAFRCRYAGLASSMCSVESWQLWNERNSAVDSNSCDCQGVNFNVLPQ